MLPPVVRCPSVGGDVSAVTDQGVGAIDAASQANPSGSVKGGTAAQDEPVGSGAVGGDAEVLGEGAAPVQRQLDAARRGVELDVLAAEALRDGEALADVEPLARGHVRRSQQEHDLVDLPGVRAGVLPRRGGDLPDRPVGGPYDAAVAPEGLRGGLQRRGAGVEGGAEECVDGGGLGHRERQGEAAEAGCRCLRGLQAHPGARAEGGVEAVGGRVVGHLEGDGCEGVHADHASSGPVAGASRFLTGLVTCFATHDGMPAAPSAARRR